MRETFAVGRVDRKTSALWLRKRRDAPFPGPWKVTAVVGPAQRDPEAASEAVVLPFPGVERA